MSDTRKIAAQNLREILEKKTFFTDKQSDAFVNMLVLTSLRHLVFIKKALKKFAKKSLPEKVAFAQYAMICATTELLYMDSPDYAVLNSYVNIIKQETDKYVSGFANAVLRNICKNKEELIKEDADEFFPSDFFKILSINYDKKTIKKIQDACMVEPPLDLTPKEAFKIADSLVLPNGTIRLQSAGRISEIEGYNEGKWWVQDFAASLPALCLGDIKGKKVLDICAAPGGKTAQLINMGADVTALDISETRLQTLRENIIRLKMPMPKIICQDGIEFLKTNDELFDSILLDAPCSATGTLRRHPEIAHIKTLKDISKQTNIQKAFLKNIGKSLKSGGILVYSVCSISKIEGEEQIYAFLKDNPDFQLVEISKKDITKNKGIDLSTLLTKEGFIRTLPQHLSEQGGMDAFFVAKLKKV